MKTSRNRFARLGLTITLSMICLAILFMVLSDTKPVIAQGGGIPAISSVSSNYAVVQHNGNPVNTNIVITMTNFTAGEVITLNLHGGINDFSPGAIVPGGPGGILAVPIYISRVVNADAMGTAVVNIPVDDTFPTDIYWFDAIGDVSGFVAERPGGNNTTPLLVVERIRTADLDPDPDETYTITLHYAVNFFNNIVGPVFAGDPAWANADDMAEDYAAYVLDAMLESYQLQIEDWGFRSPPDGDGNFHVAINDGIVNDPLRRYFGDYNGRAFFRNSFDASGEVGIHYASNYGLWLQNTLLPGVIDYTDSNLQIGSYIAHEFFHSVRNNKI